MLQSTLTCKTNTHHIWYSQFHNEVANGKLPKWFSFLISEALGLGHQRLRPRGLSINTKSLLTLFTNFPQHNRTQPLPRSLSVSTIYLPNPKEPVAWEIFGSSSQSSSVKNQGTWRYVRNWGPCKRYMHCGKQRKKFKTWVYANWKLFWFFCSKRWWSSCLLCMTRSPEPKLWRLQLGLMVISQNSIFLQHSESKRRN